MAKTGTGARQTAPSRGGPLSVRGRKGRIADAAKPFDYLPVELVSACRKLIAKYHANKARSALADVVWRAYARDLLRRDRVLRRMFEDACSVRSARLSRDSLERLAAIILASEALARDLGGWGFQHPEAKKMAERLLARALGDQARLGNIYGYPTINLYG